MARATAPGCFYLTDLILPALISQPPECSGYKLAASRWVILKHEAGSPCLSGSSAEKKKPDTAPPLLETARA